MNMKKETHLKSLPIIQGIVIVALILLTLIRAPLMASFWLDETVTCWIASAPLSTTLSRALRFQAQSPFYFLFAYGLRRLSDQELLLRAPSIIAWIGSIWLSYRLAQHWFSPSAGMLAALLFAAMPASNLPMATISARPYGLALFCSLLSVWSLERWRGCGKLHWQGIYLATLLATFYLHYLFVGIVLVHLMLAPGENSHISGKAALLTATLAFLLFLPGLAHLMIIQEHSAELIFSSPPTITALLQALLSLQLSVYVLCGGGGAAIFAGARWFKREDLPESRILRALAVWCILPPLVYFLWSHLTATPMFLPRYFLWQTPAPILLGAMLLAMIRPQSAALASQVGTALLVFLLAATRQWHIEDWRGSAAWLDNQPAAHTSKVYLQSGLIESEYWFTSRNPEVQAYLTAPLQCYSDIKQIWPLPSSPTLAASSIAQNTTEESYLISKCSSPGKACYQSDEFLKSLQHALTAANLNSESMQKFEGITGVVVGPAKNSPELIP